MSRVLNGEYEARLRDRPVPALQRCSDPDCRAADAFGRSYGGGGLLCVAERLSVAGACPTCAKRPVRAGTQLMLGQSV
jgi:hypothetical protein